MVQVPLRTCQEKARSKLTGDEAARVDVGQAVGRAGNRLIAQTGERSIVDQQNRQKKFD